MLSLHLVISLATHTCGVDTLPEKFTRRTVSDVCPLDKEGHRCGTVLRTFQVPRAGESGTGLVAGNPRRSKPGRKRTVTKTCHRAT